MKTSIYLPDDLHAKATAAGINVSQTCQEALREAIESRTRKCSRCGQELPLDQQCDS